MQQLSPQDAMFAFMESPTTPLQLGWLNIYDPSTASDGMVRFKAILAHVEQRLHTVRFFRQKLAFVPLNLDEPYWVDDEGFDLEYHVRHTALPSPGDWRQLCILVARLFARPFDLAKPLWEFYVIEGLDNVEGIPRGCFALLTKMHHAAIDGISGVDVATTLHTPEPDTPPPPPVPWHPERAPGAGELLLRAYASRVMRPGRTLGTIARAVPAFRNVRAAVDAGELTKPGRHKIPRTRFSGPVGPHRVVEARRFRIEDLKPIRELVPGATVNDVLLAIVGGGMRRYLVAKRELPDEPLIASCPISLRAPEERGQLGNKVGNMFASLATNIAEPVERLRRIREETMHAKGMTEAVGARTLSELSQLVPGAVMSLGMRVGARLSGSGAANTTVTNVPGPQHPLYLAGARIVTQFCLGTLLNGMGIFHAITSYCGEITLTIVGDRDKLPDPAFYAQCMQQAFDELRGVAASGNVVSIAGRRPRQAAPRKRAVRPAPS